MIPKDLRFLAPEDSPSKQGGHRMMRLTLDKEIVSEPPPTIDELIKHAERYGGYMVVQTAIDLGYGLEAVTRLQSRVDVIDIEHSKARKPWAERFFTRPKKSAEHRVRKLMGITDEEEA
jgi:hypothetical protein